MPRLSDNRLRQLWTAAVPDHCVGLAWSADGRHLAAAAVSGPVTVFDAAGKVAHELPGHGFGTAHLDWQPGGSLLATAGQDGKAKLWAAAAETALTGGSGWVERVAWSADGKVLATAAGKKVRLWDPDGNQLREYAGHGGTVSDLAWRPGTNVLAVAAYGGITLYDPTQADPVRVFEWKGAPLRLAWSPDGKILAHGNQDATVHFWYADPGEVLQMSGFPTKVRELSWDHSSRYLATGGGAAVCVWDCGGKGPEGTKPRMLLDDADELPLTAVAWQRRGYLIAAAGQDGRVRVWQPANKKAPLVGQDRFDGTEATAAVWSPDDKLLAAGAGSGAVAVYRLAT
jgi:WD40 repeat protein